MRARTQKETDTQLRDAVLRQVEWEPGIESKDIGVTAAEGVVTLTGFVRTYFEKFGAERVAKSVYGVKAVANDIEVKPENARTDPEIARDIVHAMKLNLSVPDDRIKVGIRDGFVTLEGTADWHFQRSAAESCARHVDGVRGVVDNIDMKPKASAIEVKTKIEDALRRSADVDARRISVATQDSTVHLYGNVRSWLEREEAERAAWGAPGVSKVVDHISIVP